MISHWCLYYNKYLNPRKEIFSARLCNILYLLVISGYIYGISSIYCLLVASQPRKKYSGFKGSNIDELSFTMRNV